MAWWKRKRGIRRLQPCRLGEAGPHALFRDEREGLEVGEIVLAVGDSVEPRKARVVAIDVLTSSSSFSSRWSAQADSRGPSPRLVLRST